MIFIETHFTHLQASNPEAMEREFQKGSVFPYKPIRHVSKDAFKPSETKVLSGILTPEHNQQDHNHKLNAPYKLGRTNLHLMQSLLARGIRVESMRGIVDYTANWTDQ